MPGYRFPEEVAAEDVVEGGREVGEAEHKVALVGSGVMNYFPEGVGGEVGGAAGDAAALEAVVCLGPRAREVDRACICRLGRVGVFGMNVTIVPRHCVGSVRAAVMVVGEVGDWTWLSMLKTM